MERVDDVQVSEPGLVVLNPAHDEATAITAVADLDHLWATSGITAVRRKLGTAGVKARVYADLRRPGTGNA
jgi:hypothetical protein